MIEEETTNHNISGIQKITQEIYEEIENFNRLLRSHISANRLRFQELKGSWDREVTGFREKIGAEKQRTVNLREEQAELKRSIEDERENYKVVESELNDIRGQITKLSIAKKNYEETLENLETKIYGINRKVESQQQKKRVREAKATKLAGYYRRFMGIDIVPEKHNILKVVFNKLSAKEDAKGYVLIDFGGEGIIVDISPPIFSIEKAQLYFRKYPNFYEFLKFLRSSFKNELEK